MNNKEEHTVTHEGWIMFCPCWFVVDEYLLMPIPKYKLGFFLDFCYWLQGICITICSLFGVECAFAFNMKELKTPFKMEI